MHKCYEKVADGSWALGELRNTIEQRSFEVHSQRMGQAGKRIDLRKD